MFDANIINRRTNPLVLTYNSWTFLKNVLFKNSLAMKFFFCLIWMIWFRHFRGDLLVCEKIFEEMINCNLQYMALQLILPWSFIFHVLVSSSKSSSPPSPLVYETPYLFYVTIFHLISFFWQDKVLLISFPILHNFLNQQFQSQCYWVKIFEIKKKMNKIK